MDGLLVSDANPTGVGEKRTFTDVRAIPSNSKYKTKDRYDCELHVDADSIGIQ